MLQCKTLLEILVIQWLFFVFFWHSEPISAWTFSVLFTLLFGYFFSQTLVPVRSIGGSRTHSCGRKIRHASSDVSLHNHLEASEDNSDWESIPFSQTPKQIPEREQLALKNFRCKVSPTRHGNGQADSLMGLLNLIWDAACIFGKAMKDMFC